MIVILSHLFSLSLSLPSSFSLSFCLSSSFFLFFHFFPHQIIYSFPLHLNYALFLMKGKNNSRNSIHVFNRYIIEKNVEPKTEREGRKERENGKEERERERESQMTEESRIINENDESEKGEEKEEEEEKERERRRFLVLLIFPFSFSETRIHLLSELFLSPSLSSFFLFLSISFCLSVSHS